MCAILSNWRWNTALFFVQALTFGVSMSLVPGSFRAAIVFITLASILVVAPAIARESWENGAAVFKRVAGANFLGCTGATLAARSPTVPDPDSGFFLVWAVVFFIFAVWTFIDASKMAAKEAINDGFPRWAGVAPLLPLGVGTIAGGTVILYYRGVERKMRRASAALAKEV